jgi:vacuolar protein sorting-associated protein 13A/C
MQLKGKPVKILIENVYLLASPASPDAHYDPEEEAKRAQAAKMEKLESAELLTTKPSAGLSAEDEAKNESFAASLTNRIVDNVQITVKNVHLRYEDDVSVPGHPFAIGVTLAGFSAMSTDKFWQPTYIHNSQEGIHKLANLDSLAIYFDSNADSLAGHPADQAIKQFNSLIAKADAKESEMVEHQYILRPVSGEGRLVLNHHANKDTPKTDAQLLFREIAFAVDEHQYKDALSMLDLFHFYTRKNQYRKYRPDQKQLEQNKSRALFQFAQKAILQEVKERHRKWTWDYFRERRDDRKLYVYCFKLNARGESTADVSSAGHLQPTSADSPDPGQGTTRRTRAEASLSRHSLLSLDSAFRAAQRKGQRQTDGATEGPTGRRER